MFLIRRSLPIVLILFASGGFLFAQFNGVPTTHGSEDTTPEQMRELVSQYCRLQYDGLGLDPQAWSKFQPIVWWSSPQKYTQIDVIARYSVDAEPEAHSNNTKYSVTVHYRLLGTYDLVNGYVTEPEGSMQTVDFLVSSENTEWRIADAENLYPHPSRAAMLKWLNGKLGTEQDPAAKERYQRALTLLQAQSASPFAK